MRPQAAQILARRIDSGARQDNQIDAAVLSAAVGGVVACYGVELGIAGGRDTLGGYGIQIDKEAGDARGASRGEFPVGVEFRGVDGNVVSVALDAQVIKRMAQRGSNLTQDGSDSGLGVAEPELRSRPRAG